MPGCRDVSYTLYATNRSKDSKHRLLGRVDGATETHPGFAWNQALAEYDVSELGRCVDIVARTNDDGTGVIFIEGSDALDAESLGKGRIEKTIGVVTQSRLAPLQAPPYQRR